MPKGIPGSGGVCTVDGCATGAIARGWCAKHYQRWRSHGDPVAGVGLTFPENLLSRMEPQPNGCIHYTGSLTLAGYGQVGKDGGNALAHRAAYEHFVGPIPEGMTLDHECHNLSGCTITGSHLPASSLCERRAPSAEVQRREHERQPELLGSQDPLPSRAPL